MKYSKVHAGLTGGLMNAGFRGACGNRKELFKLKW